VEVETNAEGTPVRTYSEEQFSGLRADKQAKVRKRQELERQLSPRQAEEGRNPASGGERRTTNSGRRRRRARRF